MMNFSENLRRYRKAAGFQSAKDFAVKIGVSYTTYKSYENSSREPRFETLCKIAAVLHVSIDDLLGGENMHDKEVYEITMAKIEEIRVVIGAMTAGVTLLIDDLEKKKHLTEKDMKEIHARLDLFLNKETVLCDKIWSADRYVRSRMR